MQTPKIMNAFFLLSFLSGLFSSCESTIVDKQYLPNTEGINASIDLVRFDRAFFELDTSQLAASLEQLRAAASRIYYGLFTSFFAGLCKPKRLATRTRLFAASRYPLYL